MNPTTPPTPRVPLLMCAPDYFEVAYRINTFMEGNIGRVNHALAKQQWNKLYETILSCGAEVELMTPHPHPDLVFTANAGLVWHKTVVVAQFFNPERQGETAVFRNWFYENGYQLVELPPEVPFEGEGDVVLRESFLWMGHSSRTTADAAATLQQVTGLEVVPLELDPEGFYHLDTCLASAGRNGLAFYYPGAFTNEGRAAIQNRLPGSRLIEVSEQEARCFACNLVFIGEHAVFPNCPPSFEEKIRNAGFVPHMVNLSEFMKAGGAVKCLTLHLTS